MNNQYQTIYQNQVRPTKAADFRRIARQRLKGHWWTAIIVTFLAALLGGIVLGGNVNFSASVGNLGVPSYDYTEETTPTVPGTEETTPTVPGTEEETTFTDEEMQAMEEAFSNGDWNTVAEIMFGEDAAMVTSVLLIVLGALIVIPILVFIARLLISSPVSVGYQRFFLEVIDGNDGEIRVGTLFRFFKQNYFKTVRLNFWYIIVMQLYLIPLWIGAIAGGAIFVSQMMTGSEEAALIGVLAFAGLTFIGAVISIIIYYPITYAYSMAHMIMADAPDVGGIEALRLSRQMMQGNKWRLFCLDFSFIGWQILAICCTCGLGTYLVTPYQYAARAAFYNEIANRRPRTRASYFSISSDDYYIN